MTPTNQSNFTPEDVLILCNNEPSIDLHVITYNYDITNSLQKGFEFLTRKTYNQVQIDVEWLMQNPNTINDIVTSIKTVCNSSKKPIPKIWVYSDLCNNNRIINELMAAGLDGISLNTSLTFTDPKEELDKYQKSQNGVCYIDPYTLKFVEPAPEIKHKRQRKLLSTKIAEGTIAYSLAPNEDKHEIIQIRPQIQKQFNLKIYDLNQISDFFPVLSDSKRKIDLIFLNAEISNSLENISTFELINTFQTLIKATNRQHITKIVVIITQKTSVLFIRDIIKHNGVFGVVGAPGWFTYQECFQQMSNLLRDKQIIPPKIQFKLNQCKKRKTTEDKDSLTTRELQVMKLLKNGAGSNKQIANTLHLTEATVKIYMGNIFKKYRVKNRTELLLKSQRDGK